MPRFPKAPMNPRVWNKVTAAPRSSLAYLFATISQKKKPSPLEMTDVSMMKIALRYSGLLTWSQPRPTNSTTTRAAGLFIRRLSLQIADEDKSFAQPRRPSVPSSR